MGVDAQSVLVVDDASGGLGEVALRLVRLGIDSFYAVDPGEAWPLAHQEASRICVVVIAPEVDLEGVARIEAELSERAPEVQRSLLAIGPCPAEPRREELRKAGVYWALWEPWDESALRMALAGAMAALPEGAGSRRSQHFPTTLLGRAFKGSTRQDGLVSSLSEGGAFVETPNPFEPGTWIKLQIEGEGGTIETEAEVVYRHFDGEHAGARRPVGMGVEFRDLSERACEQLARTLLGHKRRFEV
jgi:hypothetical protein